VLTHHDGFGIVEGDEIEYLIDRDAGTFDVTVNGAPFGTTLSGVPTDDYLWVVANCYASDVTFYEHFEPTDSDFKMLASQNLPAPAIPDPSAYFQAQAYTGDGVSIDSSGRDIFFDGNSALEPDLVWIKSTSSDLEHGVYDSIRGATQELNSDSRNAQSTVPESLVSFASDGFNVGNDTTVNDSAEDYIAWAWRQSPESGLDIIHQISDNVDATLDHSLGIRPDMILQKRLDQSDSDWVVWHSAYHATTGNTGRMYLNVNEASSTGSSAITEVGEDTFTTNSHESYYGGSAVYYLFAGIDGFSRFGSYEGNGSDDGPFIWTGFLPKYVLVKRANDAKDWFVFDGERNPYNGDSAGITDNVLGLNDTYSEGYYVYYYVDLMANGFKVRHSYDGMNTSGDTYIYAAFAEHPFGGEGVSQGRSR
jgi:hypothetical protein